MNLKEYFENETISLSKFARKHGFTERTLYNILKGDDMRISTAAKLEKATHGKVTMQDLAAEISKNKDSRA